MDTSYSDSVRNSYEEQQRAEQQVSLSKQRVNDWHRVQSISSSQGATASKEMFQEVADRVQRDFGVDSTSAYRMASKNSPEARIAWHKIQAEDHYVEDLAGNVRHGKGTVSGSIADQTLDSFYGEYSSKITDNPGAVVKQHAKDRMDIDGIEHNIQQNNNELHRKYQDITAQNHSQYSSVKKHNEDEKYITEHRVDKYEEDRIGRGRASTLFGLTDGLGRPEENVKSDLDFGRPIAKPYEPK